MILINAWRDEQINNNGFLNSIIILIKSRKEIVFAVTWTAALASIIAGEGFPPIYPTTLAILAVMMLNLSVYIYNDTIDREMDGYSEQEKKKARPIANGKVTVKNAHRFIIASGLIGIIACYLLNLSAFIIGTLYYIVLWMYSYPKIRFKTIYIVKNLVTSLVMPAAFLITGIAVENVIPFSTMFLASSYFILSFALLPAIADMLDYEEDLAFGVKTLGNTLTWKQNLMVFNIGILVIILSGLGAYIMFGMSVLVPIVLTILGVSVMGYSYKLRNESGLTASYKLRPIGYALVMLTPLVLSIGAVV